MPERPQRLRRSNGMQRLGGRCARTPADVPTFALREMEFHRPQVDECGHSQSAEDAGAGLPLLAESREIWPRASIDGVLAADAEV
ncbi:MAG: hypothetical protein WD669_07125 [Pirellulales bacterium]